MVLGSGFWVQRFWVQGLFGFRFQVSAQPLAAEVYPPQEGGQFDQRENLFRTRKKALIC
jgi:hypothetical protein